MSSLLASRHLRLADVDDIAAGCALLGSGGGGDTHALGLALRSALEARPSIAIVDPDELPADALVVNVGFVGAPVTMLEKLFTEAEVVGAVEAMQRRLGRPIDALMAAEIGGGNGLSPFLAGALLDLPVVDADGMGRAFPLSNQVSYSIYGHSALPTIAASEQGELVVIESGTNAQIERMVRALCVTMGSKCFTADYPLSGDDVRACAIPHTVSMACAIGGAVRGAKARQQDPYLALKAKLEKDWGFAVRLLFEGTVVGFEHEIRAGFGVGRVQLARPRSEHIEMTVEFQNEFLIARRGDVAVATTPDIIALTDADDLRNIASDSVRYGQRVKVIGIEAPKLMRSERALALVGPRAFGYALDYRSLATLDDLSGRTALAASSARP